eukprot:13848660-Heterocapsa_arctica.AAC.1
MEVDPPSGQSAPEALPRGLLVADPGPLYLGQGMSDPVTWISQGLQNVADALADRANAVLTVHPLDDVDKAYAKE